MSATRLAGSVRLQVISVSTMNSAPAFSAYVDSFINLATASVPDLTITKSHAGIFHAGQSAAIYAIQVTNSGAAPTVGNVSVIDTVPNGLTATGITGDSWNCLQPAGPCTRSDALGALASYPH